MNEMIKRRKDEGFTLIELMIVIAVIGILAIVLVPKMSGIKTSAKVTGVETNVKSVQANVTANINRWINKSYNDEDIATRLYVDFQASDNTLKNPISASTTISNAAAIAGMTTIGGSTAISTTQNSNDAMQILASTPSDGSGPHGGVVVELPATYTLIATNGIKITGFDDNGYIVDSTYTVKP